MEGKTGGAKISIGNLNFHPTHTHTLALLLVLGEEKALASIRVHSPKTVEHQGAGGAFPLPSLLLNSLCEQCYVDFPTIL